MSSATPSIFNTVIGPIMRGPSSSHTAASVRIGHLGRNLVEGRIRRAVFTFDPNGSLASTFRGQGSAMGLAAGLLGMDISDPDLVAAEEKCREEGLELSFKIADLAGDHPNTYYAEIEDDTGRNATFTALSVGGGIIRLTELDGRVVEDDGPLISPLMPVMVDEDPVLAFTDITSFTSMIEDGGSSLASYALAYEAALGNMEEGQVKALADRHLEVMLGSVKTGLAGTRYDDRILPRQSHLLGSPKKNVKLIPAELTNRVIRNITAVMEAKSSMEVIVAAPTAGSCGTLAGTLAAVAEITGAAKEDMCRAILAAGLLGVFISQQGGFAAEEGGCQYECGAASGMTAAALVDLMGGDAKTAMAAASMALQNTLGLICDPVADRVEVPCLGKNVMAGLNSVAAANMALAGYAQVIPLAQVIAAMKEVGEGMDGRYRCTCHGGLSITEAAQNIHKDLLQR